jgi:hypothetical protein
MKTIHFKNGQTKQVKQSVFEKRLIDQELRIIKFFDKREELVLLVNMNEVIYID